MANTSSKSSMDQDFNDVYFPSLEEFQAQTEPTAKTTLFDADSAQCPFANPFETVALTLSTESSESSSATRRLPMFQLQRGDSNVSETPISRCDDDDAVISVKKRRLDSSPVAIATTISWVDASSLGGDDYADEDDDSHNDSSLHDAVDDAADDANDDDLTADDAAIPADLITRSKTRRGKIPRLVKHDIRRYYGRMLYNVMNSHDRQLIMQWFQTFAVHSMKLYRLEDLGPLVYAEHHRDESQLIAGRNSIVSYLLQVQRRIPDLVTRLDDHYQVLRWKDRRSSQIVFQATFTGSTFEYYPEESAQVEHVRDAGPPPSLQPIAPADATCPQQLLDALPDEFDRQTLLLTTAVNLPTPPANQQAGPATPTIVGVTQPLRRVSHLVRFHIQLETTLHLNDEMLLYRWESKTLHSDTKRVSVSDL